MKTPAASKLQPGKNGSGKNTENRSCPPIFVARQPIFDQDEQIVGYELLFRGKTGADCAVIDDPNAATAGVMLEGLALVRPYINDRDKLFINFTEDLLELDYSEILAPDSTVIEVLEDVKPTPKVLDACRHFKDQGYTIAIDDYAGRPGYGELLAIADIIKVDILGMEPHEIVDVTQKVSDFSGKKLAEKVENARTRRMLRALGYDMYQGYYFSRPEIMEGRGMTPAAATRLFLLKELNRNDFDIPRISKIVSTDVALSYRLLRFLNSPYFSLTDTITSIDHAVSILGENAFRQWMTVAMVMDMRRSDKAEVHIRTGLHRARFFQILGMKSTTRIDPKPIFLLGLLSKLDAVFGIPMKDIVQGLPLNKELLGALTRKAGPYADWLDMAEAIENGEWSRAERLMGKRRFRKNLVLKAHALSGQWADRLLKAADGAGKGKRGMK